MAIAVTGGALALQRLIQPFIPPSPQLLFYPAILASARLGGFGPGALSVVLSSAAISYWFLPPFGIGIDRPADVLDLAIFGVIGMILAWLVARTTSAMERVHSAWLVAESARAKLALAGKDREEMLAIVSHDLRSPINAIVLTCFQLHQLTKSGPGAEATIRSVDRIERAARRMEVLARNLLDAAAIEGGELRIHPETVRVSDLVEGTLKLFQPLAEQKAIRLEASIRAAGSLVCDADRILQTLENLVGNALKFVPRDGTIQIAAEKASHEVVFEVHDTGPGIPAELLPRVFDRWRTGGASGAGLGLYIAKAIVEAHGGRIWAKNEGGTTMGFTLPIVEGDGLRSGGAA
ncbi:MAG TPA: ATP-binding protein [Polyangiaceae bacterium]|nr:ATP-binding protein [Polyangiaceae bacterium]